MKNLDMNIGKLVRLRGIPLILTTGVLITGLSGCGKKAECSIEGDHAHLYVSEDGYKTYFDNEYLEYDGYERQEDYISLDSENEKLLKFLDKKDLISLNDNLDVILGEAEGREDFVEYRYSYKKTRFVPAGKSIIPMKVTRYSWTTNPNHSGLTGESRVCHYVYQAYNVYKDENDKYVVVPSEEVDDIKDLVGKYNYVRRVSYKIVERGTNREVDYEDGQDDEDTKAQTQSFTGGEEVNNQTLVKRR